MTIDSCDICSSSTLTPPASYMSTHTYTVGDSTGQYEVSAFDISPVECACKMWNLTQKLHSYDCYRYLINTFEKECGKFSEYGFKYAKFFVHSCTMPPREEEAEKKTQADPRSLQCHHL